MMEASYYEQAKSGLKCRLCPHECIISNGKTGICNVRRNVNGVLMAETWSRLSAMNIDPIEKKPLYHFHPGENILSIGSLGCNMKCRCCQNWHISQSPVAGYSLGRSVEPAEVVSMALSSSGNMGIAYTYNEPTVWYEYMLAVAKVAASNRLKNVMVSNGYIAHKPLEELLDYMDAFNIDLKGFSEEFHMKFTGARLEPVLKTLKQIRKAARHLEITNLVIPSLNDHAGLFADMTNWIADELGPDTVLHLSRYHPDYNLYTEPTSPAKLEEFYEIAHKKLAYVYVGNISLGDLQNTYCKKCGELLVIRKGYQITVAGLTNSGTCIKCGNQVMIR
ncbi:MAG: AmmeMemoRadiSam system radical SAM enzyme [Bacteroidales bacterium]|nr:AmmeMemoRadiSam system radical SAM enzyme [Bacteroidales bacterium]